MIKKHVTYRISGEGFSMEFDGPDDMTIAEMKEFHKEIPFWFADDQWDSLAMLRKGTYQNYGTLPDWVMSDSPAEMEARVISQVFDGQSEADLDAWIDANVTNLANARISLKQVVGAIVSLRSMMAFEARLLVYLRDLIVRFRE